MTFKNTAALSLVVLGAFAFIAPVTAFADGAATVKAVDTDNDGTISVDEAKKAAMTKFEGMDADHEGTVDAKEGSGTDVMMADTDKDGTVDKAEFGKAVEGSFKKADADNDGTVDAKELASPAGASLDGMIKP